MPVQSPSVVRSLDHAAVQLPTMFGGGLAGGQQLCGAGLGSVEVAARCQNVDLVLEAFQRMIPRDLIADRERLSKRLRLVQQFGQHLPAAGEGCDRSITTAASRSPAAAVCRAVNRSRSWLSRFASAPKRSRIGRCEGSVHGEPVQADPGGERGVSGVERGPPRDDRLLPGLTGIGGEGA